MNNPLNPHSIALLHYPDAQLSAIAGLADLFQVADDLNGTRTGRLEPLLQVSTVSFATEPHSFVPPSDIPGFIIIPPTLNDVPRGPQVEPLLDWLRQVHADGTVLASVCAGAFLLGDAGLLAGKRVTTHWVLAEDMAERFPAAKVCADELLIDEGSIVTAGGLMAWTDLGLCVVERLLGHAAMLETARYLLVDPPGRQQRYYSAFVPKLDHRDAAISKAQAWLDEHITEPSLSMAALASIAGLEERTFQRRFQAATGLRPIAYCQSLRVDRARSLLESGVGSIDDASWAVGYRDPASFRKIFFKLTGLTPSDYRRRFSGRQQVAELEMIE